MLVNKKLTSIQTKLLLSLLKNRFEKNTQRHKNISWEEVELKLIKNPTKLWSLNEMEQTGGEPDVIGADKKVNEFIFCDCSRETPKGRRSLCYDEQALASRKEFKPKNSATKMAKDMGIKLLTEEQYQNLQQLGEFDLKSSSWLATPSAIRKLGGAIYGDRRYDHVFIYHNGAESYYAVRGFRGLLKV
ncbi:MAG: DUF4256 domain-containing protein [Candidatus Pacebacteria bacterium]|nr:DUF4256 domain-containing protein [Candidatus Paceibacterota bacterium]